MNKIIKDIIITFFLGCAIYLLANALNDGFNYNSASELVLEFVMYQLYTFVLGFSNMFYFKYLEKLNWKKTEKIKRIIIGVFGSVVITLIGLFFLRLFTAIAINGKTFNEFIQHESLNNYQFGVWVTLTIVIIFHVIYFVAQYQKQKLKEQKVIAGTASAKFDALKNQLDPHFLFNSLNVLTSLIEENPENAQKFTTSLSKVYRYVLEQKNKELISVNEELQFAKTYMSLLKMRFEDSIIFEIPEQASSEELKVVPLSLQLLLENAVKHNMVTASKPLHIKIYEKDGNLIIENNLQPKQIVKKSSGVGLNNIVQRYQLLTTKQVNINKQPSSFAVAIPMLTKQLEMNTQTTQDQVRLNDKYLRARNHVEELKGFYYSLFSYCLVIPFLIFINWYTSWHFQWFWFPLFGWGIGLAIQAFRVFVNDAAFGRDWENKKIEQYMKEEDQNRWS